MGSDLYFGCTNPGCGRVTKVVASFTPELIMGLPVQCPVCETWGVARLPAIEMVVIPAVDGERLWRRQQERRTLGGSGGS